MINEINQSILGKAMYVAIILMGVVALHQGVQAYYVAYPQPKAIEQPSLVVSATGKAYGVPDIAKLTVSVIEQGDTVAAVTQSGNDAMTKVVAGLKAAGIADKDIQTTAYNLSPRYNYNKNPYEIVGYDLTQSATVTIRQLATVSSVVDQAAQAGANSVSTPSFEIDQPEAVKNEARLDAFNKAKAQAEGLAQAAGVSLGKILTFTENDSATPGPLYYAANKDMALSSDVSAQAPIEVGNEEVNVTVNVTYAINR